MKKVKFMLFSLALVAVVGGALAFKAKQSHHFCTTLARDLGQGNFTCKDAGGVNPLKCINYISQFTVAGAAGDFVCTTDDNGSGNCNNQPDCALPVVQTVNDGE